VAKLKGEDCTLKRVTVAALHDRPHAGHRRGIEHLSKVKLVAVRLHADLVPFGACNFGVDMFSRLYPPDHPPFDVHRLVRLLLVDLVEAQGTLMVRLGPLLVDCVLGLLQDGVLGPRVGDREPVVEAALVED
jgi:hypothetical protein